MNLAVKEVINMGLKYNPEISLGNILQILTIAGSVFSAYLLLVNTDIKHQATLDKHAESITEIRQTQKETTQEVKQKLQSIDDKLTGVIIENARRNR